MKSIFEFYDYRLYMRTFYEERKRTSAFSWRQFSKLAGFSSPNYMKVVCDGKSRLCKGGIEQVANAMGLVKHEKNYFQLLVEFDNAKSEPRKEAVNRTDESGSKAARLIQVVHSRNERNRNQTIHRFPALHRPSEKDK